MSDVLKWNYSSGEAGDLFYPMNGTGNLEEEGYGQLLPIAAADYAGANSVTVLPASAYNAANAEEPEEVRKTLEEGLLYDQKKSEFLENYLDPDGVKVNRAASKDFMKKESFWKYLNEALENNSKSEIRDQSPLPNWMAKKSVDAKQFLESISEKFPVYQELYENSEDLKASDLYLPLHSAEAAIAKEKEMDGKIGISTEEPFDDFTNKETGFPSFRSVQPLGLSGEEIIPYADRSDPEDQILFSDSTQKIREKLGRSTEESTQQIKEISRQLDDDIVSEAVL